MSRQGWPRLPLPHFKRALCLQSKLRQEGICLAGYPVGSRDESMGSQQMLIRGVEEWTACIRQYEATPS